MNVKKDAHGFPVEAKFSFSSIFKLWGKMSKDGADVAGKHISSGVWWFLLCVGLSVIILSASSLLKSYAPEGMYQPKQLELQQSDSTANIRTNSEKSS